jgi:hypothetical protein
MNFYPLYLALASMSILGAIGLPIAFSIETQIESLSYTKKNCNTDSCTVTICFEDKPCIVTDSNDLPAKTTISNDKIHPMLEDFDSDLKTMDFMDMFDNYFDFN